MTNSVLGVRNIQHTNGTDAMTIDTTGKVTFENGTSYRPGEVIESIIGTCDGRTVVGTSGSYTLANVTAILNGTTSYQDITGSSIDYTPPAGTKVVLYRFTYHWDATENSGISHHRIIFDGTEIDPAYKSVSGNYVSNHHNNMSITLEHAIQCDHTSDDLDNGRVSSWTTSRNIHCEYREYSGSYESRLHANTWRDGGGASSPHDVHKPMLEIVAIA